MEGIGLQSVVNQNFLERLYESGFPVREVEFASEGKSTPQLQIFYPVFGKDRQEFHQRFFITDKG